MFSLTINAINVNLILSSSWNSANGKTILAQHWLNIVFSLGILTMKYWYYGEIGFTIKYLKLNSDIAKIMTLH